MRNPWWKKPLFWGLVILALGAALRAYRLGAWDMWTDEMNTLQTSAYGEWISGPMYRMAPINFFLTRATIAWLGPNELGVRIAPFVFGVLTIALTFVFARRWLGARAAVFAELVLTLSVWHVFWSQAGRHFSLQALLLLLMLHCFLYYWVDGRRWGLIATVALVAASLFTHSSASFYLAALLAFVAVDWIWSRVARGPRSAWSPDDRKHLVAGSVLLATFVAYLPIYVQVGSYTLAHRVPWNPPWNIVGSLAFYVSPYVALPALAGAFWLMQSRRDLALLFLSFVVTPMVLVTCASAITIASGSYCLASMAVIAALVGVAADRLLQRAADGWERWAAALLLGGVLLTQAYDCALYETFYHGLKPRWKDLCEYVQAHRGPSELVVADEGDVAQFYLGQGNASWFSAEQQAQLTHGDFPPTGVRGVWYGIYLTDSEILKKDDATIRFLLDHARLARLFPVHYGAKDRTLALFYQEAPGPPAPAR